MRWNHDLVFFLKIKCPSCNLVFILFGVVEEGRIHIFSEPIFAPCLFSTLFNLLFLKLFHTFLVLFIFQLLLGPSLCSNTSLCFRSSHIFQVFKFILEVLIEFILHFGCNFFTICLRSLRCWSIYLNISRINLIKWILVDLLLYLFVSDF